VANPDTPPELEIRFDMEPWVPNQKELLSDLESPLPINWSLRFIHNQLFEYFQFPSRFCPGPFHSTILRKADWRSPEDKKKYFEMCDTVIQKWREDGPKPLNEGKWDIDGSPLSDPPEYTSGLWLFKDRNNITHFFPPNFLPPYDTVEKRETILKYISKEWDEDKLMFKPAGTKKIVDDDHTVSGCFNVIKNDIFSFS